MIAVSWLQMQLADRDVVHHTTFCALASESLDMFGNNSIPDDIEGNATCPSVPLSHRGRLHLG